MCKRESSAKFDAAPPTPYKNDHAEWGPLLVVECRGLEFVGFDPRGDWSCQGIESKTRFTDVDLSEGEWIDYDEKAAIPVRVHQFDSKWGRA